MLTKNTIHLMDCATGLRQMEDCSVQCCVTSPPYWNIRDYGHPQQYGQEKTPALYLENLVSIFSEVRRVLKLDGVLWLNMGDTYWSSNKRRLEKNSVNRGQSFKNGWQTSSTFHLKNKDLIGLPWLLALAMRESGWYLRQDIIWSKPNPMPESVLDRCVKSHEYIFLFSKSPNYYFDHRSIMQPLASSSILRLEQNLTMQKGSSRVPGKTNGPMKAAISRHQPEQNGRMQEFIKKGFANKRSVWVVSSENSRADHFATFPERLISDCIKAGSRVGDLVLDPFMGTGTTAVVAAVMQREFIGFEINPRYVQHATARIRERMGLFHP